MSLRTLAALCCAFVVLSATGLVTADAAYAGPGDPIPGVGVGLEHDPEGIAVASGTTDRAGNVTFGNLKPGRYRVVLQDVSKLKSGCCVVQTPKTGQSAAIVFPVGSSVGTIAVQGKEGRRFVVEVPAAPGASGSKENKAGSVTLTLLTAK